MSDAIEANLLGLATRKDGEVAITFGVKNPDDKKKIAHFVECVGHQFGLAFSHINPQPAQEEKSGESYKGTKPPAAPNRSPGALTGYALGAVTRCRDFEFQDFLSAGFPHELGTDTLRQLVDFRLMRPDSFDTDTGIREGLAKKIVLGLMGDIESRKEIIEGTDAGNRWEILMDRFSRWKERKAADQSRNG